MILRLHLICRCTYFTREFVSSLNDYPIHQQESPFHKYVPRKEAEILPADFHREKLVGRAFRGFISRVCGLGFDIMGLFGTLDCLRLVLVQTLGNMVIFFVLGSFLR